MFRELIKVCDKKVNPGLLKIKWTADVSQLYISDCLLCISEVRIKFSYIDNLLFSYYHDGSNVCHPHCVYRYVPIKTISPYMVLYSGDLERYMLHIVEGCKEGAHIAVAIHSTKNYRQDLFLM